MEFQGNLASVCEYLEILSLYPTKVRKLLEKITVTSIVSDTRKIEPGSIFYAKAGAHFNPFKSEILSQIKAKGAVAVLVDDPCPLPDKNSALLGGNYESLCEGHSKAFINHCMEVNPKLAKIWNLSLPLCDYPALHVIDKIHASGFSERISLSELKYDFPLEERRKGKFAFTEPTSNVANARIAFECISLCQEWDDIAQSGLFRLVLPSHKSIGNLASFIYHNPSSKVRVIGVTGTNGKSTITNLVAQMLEHCGYKCAVFGTLGYGFLDDLQKSANTTLDPVSLQQLLAQYHQKGAQYAVLEVSSIGICEGRVDGINFFAGAFSNLTRDHLDYHKEIADYFASKEQFIDKVPKSRLVINAEDPYGRQLLTKHEDAFAITFDNRKLAKDAFKRVLTISHINFKPSSLELTINRNSNNAVKVNLNLLGRFNAENYAVALGLMLSLGFDFNSIIRITSKLHPILGRMECFTDVELDKVDSLSSQFPRLIVDYAHTPDGVEQALKAARSHTSSKGRVFAILGCGGDRDKGKRPIMAIKGSVFADYAIFTADNPRSENLDDILDDMLAGIKPCGSALEYKSKDQADSAEDKEASIVLKESDEQNKFNDSMFAHKVGSVHINVDKYGELKMSLAEISKYLKQSFPVNDPRKDDEVEIPEGYGSYRNVMVIPDRYSAIKFAFDNACGDDCVVIAGKGHEDYQIFADKVIHFSDREVCYKLLDLNKPSLLATFKQSEASQNTPAPEAKPKRACKAKSAKVEQSAQVLASDEDQKQEEAKESKTTKATKATEAKATKETKATVAKATKTTKASVVKATKEQEAVEVKEAKATKRTTKSSRSTKKTSE